MLYLAWRYGSENPYCLFNLLGPDFVPLEDPTAEPRPPRFPSRLKLWIYGMAVFANESEGGSQRRRRREQ